MCFFDSSRFYSDRNFSATGGRDEMLRLLDIQESLSHPTGQIPDTDTEQSLNTDPIAKEVRENTKQVFSNLDLYSLI